MSVALFSFASGGYQWRSGERKSIPPSLFFVLVKISNSEQVPLSRINRGSINRSRMSPRWRSERRRAIADERSLTIAARKLVSLICFHSVPVQHNYNHLTHPDLLRSRRGGVGCVLSCKTAACTSGRLTWPGPFICKLRR